MTFPKIVGLIAGILTVLGFLAAGLNYVVTSAIDTALKQPGVDLAIITEQGKGLRRDVDRLLDRAARSTLQSTAVISPEHAAGEIKEAAAWAAQRKLEVDPKDILKVSEILPSSHTPESWQAMMALLNLRSVVNTTLEYAKQHVTASFHAAPNIEFPEREKGSDGWFEFVGGTIKLDGKLGDSGILVDKFTGRPPTMIDNLIVKDSHVVYGGGKITLIDVFFENCTFEITDNENGRRIAKSILNPDPYTSFSGG